nr:hypothetical protein CYJ94_11345 [Micrococcus luteus]
MLLNLFRGRWVSLEVMSRDVISGEVWAVIGPLFPAVKTAGRPPMNRRTVVEATAWWFRTGAPLRDVSERFGNWNTIYKNFNRGSRWASGRGRPGAAPHPGRCPAWPRPPRSRSGSHPGMRRRNPRAPAGSGRCSEGGSGWSWCLPWTVGAGAPIEPLLA